MMLPFLLVLLVGTLEFGSYLNQSSTLEKAIRAGAMYGARNDIPFTSTVETQIENVVKTGDPAGSGSFLIAGWSDADADVDVSTSTYTDVANDVEVTVIRLEATVPYDPMLPGLFSSLGFTAPTMTAEHEQSHIGN